jgi:hypothetical protein
MPLVHECEDDGCSALTMGKFCIEHEQGVEQSLSDDLTAVVASMVQVNGDRQGE